MVGVSNQPITTLVTSHLVLCVGFGLILRTDALRPRARIIKQGTLTPYPIPTLSSGKPISDVLREPNNKALVNAIQQNALKKKSVKGRRAKKAKYKSRPQRQPIPSTQSPVYLKPTMSRANLRPHNRHRLPKNPALDLVENRRVRPVAESSKNGTLASEFNKLNHLPQHDHPASDSKDGELDIKWSNDMFFIKWGYTSLAEKMKVRRAPHASTGAPWPLPQRYARNENLIYRIEENSFRFTVPKENCDIIENAVERFKRIILEDSVEDLYDNLQNTENTNINDPRIKYESDTYRKAPLLNEVAVVVKKPCVKFPSLDMDESYTIEITDKGKRIVANEVWGVLRGLETFSQLVWKGTDSKLYVMETIALDRPRFPHRGVLIDTARHYIFKDVIFDVLRGMEHNKLNVFHWHMTDDQSFPFQSQVFPEMSEKGAYHPSYVYTHEDVAEIVEFARMRGIRVIPEFDVPGHTYAWGHGRPELISKCYSKEKPTFGMVGPIDPSKESTYTFLRELFKEILDLFPDEFVHGGGDEVPDECWRENQVLMADGQRLVEADSGIIHNLEKKIKDTIRPNIITARISTRKLWEYFENRFMKEVLDVGKKRRQGVQFLLWQEAATEGNIQFTNQTIAEIWMGDARLMREAIDLGYRVLYSACWYLDMIKFGPDWPKYYECDPAFPGQGVDERKVLGGEACLWAEYVDNENLMSRLWPRASAAAERLWSDRNVRDVNAAAPRLQEHRCRMLSRGLAVDTISGPDYCLRKGRVGGHQWSPNYSYSVRRETEPADMLKNSLLVVVQVIVVLLIVGAVMKTPFPMRMFKGVRHTKRVAILMSFMGLIGMAVLGYSGVWLWMSL